MTIKHHFFFLHTGCNQLSARSSWNTKDSPGPSWLSSGPVGGSGADNPAKWRIIQKPFPFGLGRSVHAPPECGCMRASLPDLGCTVGSGHGPGQAALREAVSSSCVATGRGQVTMWAVPGCAQGFSIGPSPVRSPSFSALPGLTLPMASPGSFALWLPGRSE